MPDEPKAPPLALMHKTKLFEARRVLVRDPESKSGWSFIPGPAEVTDKVNDWIDETGNFVVSVSPPAYHEAWLDEHQDTMAVTVGVVVVYRPAIQ